MEFQTSFEGLNLLRLQSGKIGGEQTQVYPSWHAIGCDHGNGMESCWAVRICVRTRQGVQQGRPQMCSLFRVTAASNHANAGIPFIKEENQNQKTAA
jgi:hypothetical protein